MKTSVEHLADRETALVFNPRNKNLVAVKMLNKPGYGIVISTGNSNHSIGGEVNISDWSGFFGELRLRTAEK